MTGLFWDVEMANGRAVLGLFVVTGLFWGSL